MEGLFPQEGFPVGVDHREVPVKVIESVADESARFRFDYLVVTVEVENDQAVYPLSWVDPHDTFNEVYYSHPVLLLLPPIIPAATATVATTTAVSPQKKKYPHTMALLMVTMADCCGAALLMTVQQRRTIKRLGAATCIHCTPIPHHFLGL